MLMKQLTGGNVASEKAYYNFFAPEISTTITLDFTPSMVYLVGAHTSSAYNPIVEKWENGTYYYGVGTSVGWNSRETTPMSLTSNGGSSIYNDFVVSGNTITITPAASRNAYYVEAH